MMCFLTQPSLKKRALHTPPATSLHIQIFQPKKEELKCNCRHNLMNISYSLLIHRTQGFVKLKHHQ